MAANPAKVTTTLDVKNMARHLGFHATQVEVSALVADVAEELDLYSVSVEEDGNSFLVYSVQELEVAEEPEVDPNVFAFSAPAGFKLVA